MTKVRAHPGIREQGEAALGPSQDRPSSGFLRQEAESGSQAKSHRPWAPGLQQRLW